MKNITFLAGVMLGMILLPYRIYAAEIKQETAIFAGGCFWSMQHDFEKFPGVISTTVGYTGGNVVNPSYEQVSAGMTGHYEAIQIVYDLAKTNYSKLLDFYWHDTDPTNATGQLLPAKSFYPAEDYHQHYSDKHPENYNAYRSGCRRDATLDAIWGN